MSEPTTPEAIAALLIPHVQQVNAALQQLNGILLKSFGHITAMTQAILQVEDQLAYIAMREEAAAATTAAVARHWSTRGDLDAVAHPSVPYRQSR